MEQAAKDCYARRHRACIFIDICHLIKNSPADTISVAQILLAWVLSNK